METVGWTFVAVVFAGIIGLCDVRVCIGPVGHCNPVGSPSLVVDVEVPE